MLEDLVDESAQVDRVASLSPSHQIPWGVIAAVIASMSVFVLTLGITYPLLALLLERQGVGEVMIGLNAAMTPLGLIVSAPLIPGVAQRVGAWRLAIICNVVMIILFILFGVFRTLTAWFVLRFVLGVIVSSLFIISETWINQLVTARTRGRVMGIYVTVLSLGFAVGPFLIPFTGIEGWTPLLVGVAGSGVALLTLLGVRRTVPAFQDETRPSLYKFLPLAPKLLVAILVVALFDQAVLSFLPLYGLRHGLTEATVAYALGMLIVGNVFLQYPIGWLADQISRQALMVTCTLLTVMGSFVLPAAITQPALLWPLLFIWGGVAFGVYTIALVELGDRFSGAMLLAGNATFALMWGIGGLVGSPLAGGAMKLLGPNGLPLTLGATYAAFALVVIIMRREGSGSM